MSFNLMGTYMSGELLLKLVDEASPESLSASISQTRRISKTVLLIIPSYQI